jgi:hypothetical protein
MIIVLIFVFDPLAILLVIAANISILSLTKKEETGIVDFVAVDEVDPTPPTVAPKKVVKKRKPKKKIEVVVENPTDFFAMEKNTSTHDIPAPDPPRRSWRDGKIIIDENNVRNM